MRPMLATPTVTVPGGDQWAHEVKWDGMRLLTDVSGGGLRLFSRTEREVTVAFPELRGLAEEFDDMLLDGEVVCLRDGLPSFAALAERMHVTDARRAARLAETNPVTLMAFDLLRLYGVDLMARPWLDRRRTLERLELESPRWQTPPTFAEGAVLHAATKAQGLEGVVSKRVDSAYLPGQRSSAWLKIAHRATVSVVIGGWRAEVTDAAGGGNRLGAVLVGVPGPGGLRYLGRVGSGLAGRAGSRLLRDLSPIGADDSPFATDVPREDAAGARWVHPVLVADVQSLGRSGQGRLRHPSYKGLRADLAPDDLDDAQDADADDTDDTDDAGAS
ncbi:MAG: non-homologous end-joining DNA ligase [Humibacillus sp.]|nr:non-homologous end-joining DNA ligase [Humibacillus sp.]MDN5778236.1 non-homologous end-joining DNA ligase [Humibacillus sp.]